MTSIVHELQNDTLRKDIKLTDLLMKALLVARKLKIRDFESWVNCELDGYNKDQEAPKYRHLYSQIMVKNPYHGWQPVIFADRERDEMINNVRMTQPISEIEQLRHVKDGDIALSVPSDLARHIHESTGFELPVGRFVTKATIEKICESVRKVILEWALNLEEQGILGENMSFTIEEKTKATAHQEITITNFQGVLGNVSNSDVSQNLNLSIRKNNLDDLIKSLEHHNINKQDIDSLTAAIKSDPLPDSQGHFGENVAGWIGDMISKAATGTWKISIGVASSLLVKIISAYYGY